MASADSLGQYVEQVLGEVRGVCDAWLPGADDGAVQRGQLAQTVEAGVRQLILLVHLPVHLPPHNASSVCKDVHKVER